MYIETVENFSILWYWWDMQCLVVLQFVCAPLVLHQVRGKLEKLQYNIRTADCELIPKIQVTLSDADLEAVRKLCDKLVDDPDVVRLYDNIA